MTSFRLPTIFSMILIATAVSACGGSAPGGARPSVQTAAATHVVDRSADPASAGQTPVPDCAAENSSGLRIIDRNAEAFRIDAMRRAGAGG